MKIKKILAVMLFVLSFTFLMSVESFAATDESYKQIYERINEEGRTLLSDAGINDVDFEELMSLSPKKVFTAIISVAKGSYKQPLTVFVTLVGFFIATALVKSSGGRLGDKNEMFSLFETAFALSVTSVDPNRFRGNIIRKDRCEFYARLHTRFYRAYFRKRTADNLFCLQLGSAYICRDCGKGNRYFYYSSDCRYDLP